MLPALLSGHLKSPLLRKLSSVRCQSPLPSLDCLYISLRFLGRTCWDFS